MEEEQRLEKSPLAGNKDKFSFSFSNRKLLGYVRAWAGMGSHTVSHITYVPPHCARSPYYTWQMPCTALYHTGTHIHCLHTPVDIPNHA